MFAHVSAQKVVTTVTTFVIVILPLLAEFSCGRRLLSCCVDSLSREARKPPGCASPQGRAPSSLGGLQERGSLTPTASFRPITQRRLMPGAKNAGEPQEGHPVYPTQAAPSRCILEEAPRRVGSAGHAL